MSIGQNVLCPVLMVQSQVELQKDITNGKERMAARKLEKKEKKDKE